MNKIIRIGTRDSELALWQANTVKKGLEDFGYQTQLVPVKSTGDIVLDQPLYEMGITGIFTKTLDIAMLTGQIDIAVHSLKDVPTLLPKGIVQTAVLPRASHLDVLVHNGNFDYTQPNKIATGSLRRKAQWLHRFPNNEVTDLRGNVNTRLQKLKDNDWQGAIFAEAGLERLGFISEKNIKSPTFEGFAEQLDWMLPAPAQGAMVIVALQNDNFSIEATKKLNDLSSEICTTIERTFLNKLEGGCTAPIGALATIIEDKIQFKGCLFSLDGVKKIEVEDSIAFQNDTSSIEKYKDFAKNCAQTILENGGRQLMATIKAILK